MNESWMDEWMNDRWRSGDTIEESWGFTTSRVEMDHQGGAWNARNIMYVYWLYYNMQDIKGCESAVA